MRQRPGFSLIEVLVVVVIIALLFAILLPSLKQARMQGRAVVCRSNMRQLGLAVHMYASHHKGYLIDYGLAHGGSVSEETTWLNTLRREYGGKLVARCPVDKSPYWTQPYGSAEGELRRTSYGVNEYLTGRLSGYEAYRQADRIKRQSSTIIFVEMVEDTDYAVADHVHPVNWTLNPLEEASKQMALERHMKKANYTFVDGHAAAHFFEQTYKINDRRREGPRLVIDWGHNMYDPKLGY